ncbi:MAG: hypothetical protein WBX15_17275 [Thermoanaerobaculia bacterium]
MPLETKFDLESERASRRQWLEHPAIGMEAEFNVFLDGEEIDPRAYWGHPTAFITDPLLERTRSSYQLPTGGAVYFDRGVIEVVTPLVEIAPGCSARVVRSLWEQIAFVRDALTGWGRRNDHEIRLKAYSAHYNVSFDVPRAEQNRERNVRTLALLLAYILPAPLMILATNRRSTGIGVRPRGNRIEVTADFTPEPLLMIAAATCVVGMVREVMSWRSYTLDELEWHGIPRFDGVIPGKHTTRKGWLTKDFHYPKSPYTSDIDHDRWRTDDGRMVTLRELACATVTPFAAAIRKHADAFSFRLLFSVLRGSTPSLLELEDRPLAYDDVGRLCRWGHVIPELTGSVAARTFASERKTLWKEPPFDQYVAGRERERASVMLRSHTHPTPDQKQRNDDEITERTPDPVARPSRSRPKRRPPSRPASNASRPVSRRTTARSSLLTSSGRYVDRRARTGRQLSEPQRRARGERRSVQRTIPFPDRRLTRSAYEEVFLKLVSGQCLAIGGLLYRPVAMKGWYHALFRCETDGSERMLTIDQLVKKKDDWR